MERIYKSLWWPVKQRNQKVYEELPEPRASGGLVVLILCCLYIYVSLICIEKAEQQPRQVKQGGSKPVRWTFPSGQYVSFNMGKWLPEKWFHYWEEWKGHFQSFTVLCACVCVFLFSFLTASTSSFNQSSLDVKLAKLPKIFVWNKSCTVFEWFCMLIRKSISGLMIPIWIQPASYCCWSSSFGSKLIYFITEKPST